MILLPGAALLLDLNKTYITLCDITIQLQSTYI